VSKHSEVCGLIYYLLYRLLFTIYLIIFSPYPRVTSG